MDQTESRRDGFSQPPRRMIECAASRVYRTGSWSACASRRRGRARSEVVAAARANLVRDELSRSCDVRIRIERSTSRIERLSSASEGIDTRRGRRALLPAIGQPASSEDDAEPRLPRSTQRRDPRNANYLVVSEPMAPPSESRRGFRGREHCGDVSYRQYFCEYER